MKRTGQSRMRRAKSGSREWQTNEPKVAVRDDTHDPEWLSGRLQPLLADLPSVIAIPKELTVTFPATRHDVDDSITITIAEGDVTRETIFLSGEVKGGIPQASGEKVTLSGGLRVDQLGRFISALQRAAAEAQRLGILTPRSMPSLFQTLAEELRIRASK